MNKLNDVIFARCLAVFSLVIWHTSCIYTGWGDCVSSPVDSFYQKMFGCLIPYANMPLFTFLAGYLFRYQYVNRKYSDGKLFVKNKVRRLLIPYILLGTAAVYLQYGCSNQLSEVFYGAPNHLWFCLMLFYCYVICWVLESRSLRWVNICFAVISLGIISRFSDWGVLYHAYHIPLGIEIAAYFYFYFFLGYLCFDARKNLFAHWKHIAVYVMLYVVVRDHIIPAVDYIFFVMTISYLISRVLSRYKGIWNGFEKVATCSFGIYVIHHIILWNVVHYPGIAAYSIPILEEHYIIAPVILCIAVFFTCFLITYGLLKSKTGKFLLG